METSKLTLKKSRDHKELNPRQLGSEARILSTLGCAIPFKMIDDFRIIIVLVPLAFILYDVQHRYRPASRDLKRVSSTSLSPIYSHFSETLSGLTTVRAMKSVGRFEQECLDKVEANQKAQYASVAASLWLELRLQMIGVAVVVGVSFIAVIQHDSKNVDPGKRSALVTVFSREQKATFYFLLAQTLLLYPCFCSTDGAVRIFHRVQ